MTEAAATGRPRMQNNFYALEVRFGVVMYGGVSLAIYINGVTNELYEMACATPKERDDLSIPGTRDVYRKASWLLRDDALRTRYLEHLNGSGDDPFADMDALPPGLRTRFVVDTLAGTSAGGINGLFLAKALANGQEFAPLKALWVQEGDIGRLLNDDASYEGLEFAKTDDPPQSLLNSDRMYIKLLDAFEKMKRVIAPAIVGGSQLVDELDLFITTTDIRGAVVPLRLFDKVVYEQRYKQVYHFQYAAGGDNHFADSYAPFLAFAARCTSSFPFAFEPMSVSDAQRLCDARSTEEPVSFDDWKSFFTGLSTADMGNGGWRKRAFGDGGYLDNKPFSYVCEALSWRLGEVPMERKLIYVEPSPAHPETGPQSSNKKPDAVENAVAALFTIPQDETIREDLETILARNRRIERVERIVRQVEIDIELRQIDPFARIELDEHGKVPAWRSRDMLQMVNYYGVAFLPYRHLRLMTVTDDIAERLAIWWGIDRHSDRLYALRALARAWREENFFEYASDAKGRTQSVNAYLDDYDVKYRLRRTGFVLRKVHQLRSLFTKPELPGDSDAWSDAERHLMKQWDKHVSSREPPRGPMNTQALLAALNCLAGWLGEAIAELRSATWQVQAPDNPARAGCHDGLIQTLRVLLGEKPDPDLKPLRTISGRLVPLPSELPPPSPLRTLQENVFTRAKKLFAFAKEVEPTELQVALEADIRSLKESYTPVMGVRLDGKMPLPHALLGNPELVPSNEVDGPQVRIEVRDVELPGDVTALNTPEGTTVREFLAEYFMRFDEYDQASFPLYYDTGTGEPSTVEVVRISPEDATSLIDERNSPRRKLAGTAVAHFGAFLDARWRRNDILWGRLDGCERLLVTLFPAPEDDLIRKALLKEAQRTIVREEMQPEEYNELIDRFVEVLAAQNQPTLDEAFNALWAQLPLTAANQRRTQIGIALKAVMSDVGMLNYLSDFYEVDRDLDPKATLKTGARALTVTGKILEEAEKHHRAPFARMVWLTRAGRALQALLMVSTPGTLPRTIFRHWLILLYVFEALIVVGAIVLAAPATRTFGLTIFVITAVVHLASLITGDYMVRSSRWLKRALTALVVTLLVLMLFGAVAVLNDGPGHVFCSAGHGARNGIFGLLCKQNDSPKPATATH